MISAEQETDARQEIFRTVHQVVAPCRRQQTVIAGLEHRVEIKRLLVTGQSLSGVFGTNLPAAGISAEKGHIPSLCDPGFQTITHPGGPIFVMADTQDQRIVFQKFRSLLQIKV